MLLSFALIFLVGLFASAVSKKLHLPGIVGMLAVGVLLGPCALDLIDPTVLGISSELRQMAHIIILIRAGLSFDLSDLRRVGRPAVMMSFVPACFEIIGYVLLTPHLLGMTSIDGAIIGAVLGAVSPAVVVPRMIRLTELGYCSNKCIPQLITAGASCDDIVVIVLFSAFVNAASGNGVYRGLFEYSDVDSSRRDPRCCSRIHAVSRISAVPR